MPHLHRDWAHPCLVFAETGLARLRVRMRACLGLRRTTARHWCQVGQNILTPNSEYVFCVHVTKTTVYRGCAGPAPSIRNGRKTRRRTDALPFPMRA